MVPSQTDFTIYNIFFTKSNTKYVEIKYRYIVNIGNDVYQNSVMYYRQKL
jgi:hypothetical protein